MAKKFSRLLVLSAVSVPATIAAPIVLNNQKSLITNNNDSDNSNNIEFKKKVFNYHEVFAINNIDIQDDVITKEFIINKIIANKNNLINFANDINLTKTNFKNLLIQKDLINGLIYIDITFNNLAPFSKKNVSIVINGFSKKMPSFIKKTSLLLPSNIELNDANAKIIREIVLENVKTKSNLPPDSTIIVYDPVFNSTKKLTYTIKTSKYYDNNLEVKDNKTFEIDVISSFNRNSKTTYSLLPFPFEKDNIDGSEIISNKTINDISFTDMLMFVKENINNLYFNAPVNLLTDEDYIISIDEENSRPSLGLLSINVGLRKIYIEDSVIEDNDVSSRLIIYGIKPVKPTKINYITLAWGDGREVRDPTKFIPYIKTEIMTNDYYSIPKNSNIEVKFHTSYKTGYAYTLVLYNYFNNDGWLKLEKAIGTINVDGFKVNAPEFNPPIIPNLNDNENDIGFIDTSFLGVDATVWISILCSILLVLIIIAIALIIKKEKQKQKVKTRTVEPSVKSRYTVNAGFAPTKKDVYRNLSYHPKSNFESKQPIRKPSNKKN